MIGAPKPPPREPKPPKRLKRSWLKRGTKPLPKVNRVRQERKRASYAKVLRSDFHKRLRYLAYERSRGFCECAECVRERRSAYKIVPPGWKLFGIARMKIPVWFTQTGTMPHQRFRSTEGELHHDSYHLFGKENPEELALVRWVWKSCHRRIEAATGKRHHFLAGSR